MENGKNKVKNFFLAVIVALVVSAIVFYIWDVPEWLYFLVLLGVWLFFLLQYPMGKNIGLYSRLLACSISNSLVYFSFKLQTYNWERFCECYSLPWKILSAVYGILFFRIVLNVLRKCLVTTTNKIEEAGTTKTLFVERENDLKRLRDYLDNFSIVGLNGDWGSGKSFLTDQLKDDFHMVKIDLLSCNLEEVQSLVIRELDKVLKEEGVLSPFSPKIRKMLNQGGIPEKIGGLFIKDDVLFTEALEQFRKDLNHLPFRILIVFEDLDRVENPDVIKKIMGISEKLAGENIRVLYQFFEDHLVEKGIDRAYLEKYIPFTVNLTDIPFEKMLEYVFNFFSKEELKFEKKDFDFLLYTFSTISGEKSYRAIIEKNNVTIRKIEHFLEETNQVLKESKEYLGNEKTVIIFFLIKHFCDRLYRELEMGESLLDMALYYYNEQKISYRELKRELGEDKDEIEKVFSDPRNRQVSAFFDLLNYRFSDGIKVERDQRDEKTDRIISSLLGRGKSELTDSEYVIRYFFDEVINSPKHAQMKCFSEMTNRLYRSEPLNNNKDDNESIFMFGDSEIVRLAKAMKKTEIVSRQKDFSDNWKKFLEFVFFYKNECNEKCIDEDLVECLTYCETPDCQSYLYTLQQFNQLEICSNLKDEPNYVQFLIKYLRQLRRFGFNNVLFLELLYEKKFDQKVFDQVFESIEDNFEQKDGITLLDVEVIKAFLDKNRDIVMYRSLDSKVNE